MSVTFQSLDLARGYLSDASRILRQAEVPNIRGHVTALTTIT